MLLNALRCTMSDEAMSTSKVVSKTECFWYHWWGKLNHLDLVESFNYTLTLKILHLSWSRMADTMPSSLLQSPIYISALSFVYHSSVLYVLSFKKTQSTSSFIKHYSFEWSCPDHLASLKKIPIRVSRLLFRALSHRTIHIQRATTSKANAKVQHAPRTRCCTASTIGRGPEITETSAVKIFGMFDMPRDLGALTKEHLVEKD